jgi:hypothetical protein
MEFEGDNVRPHAVQTGVGEPSSAVSNMMKSHGLIHGVINLRNHHRLCT